MRITSDRVAAFPLIAVEAAALALMSRHFTFAACAAAAALILLPGWLEFRLTRVQVQTLALILAVAFAVKSRVVSPAHFPSARAFLPYAYGYAVAQFCIMLQLVLCFVLARARRQPGLVLLLGVLAMIYAGNKYTVSEEREIYRFASLAFMALSGIYLTTLAQRRPDEPGKRPAAGRVYLTSAAVVLAALTAWETGSFLIAAEPYATRFLGRLQFAPDTEKWRAGFSSQSALESIRHWKRSDENGIALRVVSRRPPAYLRGRMFTSFDGRFWTTEGNPVKDSYELPVQAARDLFSLSPGEDLFYIGETPRPPAARNLKPEEYWEIEIHPIQPIEDVLFTSLGARFLAAQLKMPGTGGQKAITAGPGGAASSAALPRDAKYRLFVPERPSIPILTEADRPAYLSLPRRVDPRVVNLSREIFRGCSTPREKMQAVERFFRMNFTYELAFLTHLPPRTNLLTYFLLNRPAAHCEYFATASVVLLRLAGVPSRYITGFVCEEKNFYGNYWIARNRDAHAWVEAWDDERGWVIVESTPPEGIPGRSKSLESSRTGQVWDALKFYLSKTKAAIQAGKLKRYLLDLLDALIWKTLYFRTAPGFLAAVALLAAAVLYLIRLRRRRHPIPPDPLIAALHQQLRVMDRRMGRRNLHRKPCETLHQFAARIAAAGHQDQRLGQVAGWYQRYAVLRYGGDLDAESVRKLKESILHQQR